MANKAMDPREVERNIRALQKAVIEKEPASVAINILEILKRDVFPTEELLRTTKAGIIISKLKANPNKDVARIAAEIVSKWKRTIQSRPKAATAAKVMSPAPSNEPKTFKGDSSKRRWENEKVDVKRTGEQTRDACIGLLYNGLCFMSEESSSNIITKALEIEKAAFEHFRGDNAEYRAKLRSLFQNLKAVSNRELGRKVMSVIDERKTKRFIKKT
ncbi:Transcription elongation factor S-II [Golovinomyces cichoracearum]|uniref:Transcription elongation factor S-II n=1 Tax=Golovinomyces cichoracearum TaxID=62708 RepID=A0A420HZM6_9PEZI|nr:Transcription elongation factor S-II [Golovinomyces cichoracearum]